MTTIDFGLALQNQLTERQQRNDARNGVERIYSRKQIEQAFLETFELIGGVSRLALWANDPANYDKFLVLLMRLAPKEVGGAMKGQILEYRSNVPQSPLNRKAEDEVIAEGEFTEDTP
jgi:hypothetical protein